MLTVLAILTIALLTILTVSTLLTILTIHLAVLLTCLLTIFGMFTILKNEVQSDYGVNEKIERYNSKSPDTLYIYAFRICNVYILH